MKFCNNIISLAKICMFIFDLLFPFYNLYHEIIVHRNNARLRGYFSRIWLNSGLDFWLFNFMFIKYNFLNTQCYKPLLKLINLQMLPLFVDLVLNLLVRYFTLGTLISFIFQFLKSFSHTLNMLPLSTKFALYMPWFGFCSANIAYIFLFAFLSLFSLLLVFFSGTLSITFTWNGIPVIVRELKQFVFVVIFLSCACLM